MRFFDAHTHVQFAAYAADREEVIRRASAAGVRMVNVGTQKDTSRAAVELAYQYDGVYAAIGVQPIHAGGHSYHDRNELKNPPPEEGERFDYDYYKRLAQHPKVVAIGECGLDYFHIKHLKKIESEHKIFDFPSNCTAFDDAADKQSLGFLDQINLAREVRKPLMIHCREAFDELISLLANSGNANKLNDPPGVVHFFSGTASDAKKLLDMGFYFTFGGVITFARNYDEVIKFIPLDRLLSETDAPYVAPAPYRGKRNEPVYVVEVVKKLAAIKDVSLEEMSAQILKNTENCFNLKLD